MLLEHRKQSGDGEQDQQKESDVPPQIAFGRNVRLITEFVDHILFVVKIIVAVVVAPFAVMSFRVYGILVSCVLASASNFVSAVSAASCGRGDTLATVAAVHKFKACQSSFPWVNDAELSRGLQAPVSSGHLGAMAVFGYLTKLFNTI